MGIIATLLHIAVAIGLVKTVDWHPSIANGIAFIVANFSSYVGNTSWSFREKFGMRSWQRYTAVSLLALLMTMAICWMVDVLGGHFLLGIMLTVAFVPVLAYSCHKNFTYRKSGA